MPIKLMEFLKSIIQKFKVILGSKKIKIVTFIISCDILMSVTKKYDFLYGSLCPEYVSKKLQNRDFANLSLRLKSVSKKSTKMFECIVK